MEKERKVKVLSIAALVVAVLGLTVAFAALSTTLTISGQAKVQAGTWDVHFNGTDGQTSSITPTTEGTASANNATISTTTIDGVNVTLKKPGDSATYTFYVENNGSIDAKISTLSMVQPTCDPDAIDGSNETVCGNLDYKLEYDGSAEAIDDGDTQKATGSTNPGVSDVLPSKTKRKMKLTIGYKMSATQIPASEVNVTIPALTITYSQN